MVILEQDGAGIVAQAQTDGMGKASFHPPGPGFYVVSVREPGYEEASERIDLNTNPNAYVTLNVLLREAESELS